MAAGMKLLLFVVPALAATAALSACGGGNGDAGTGSRITDPALVPTATPMQNPVTFRSVNDDIQVTQGGSSSGGAAQPQTHTVLAGETCQDIADQYGITVEALIRANRNVNAECTNLREGDNLRIPAAAPTPGAGGAQTPSAGAGTYVVQPGDTCSDIAAQFGVTADEIIALNNLDPGCTTLQPGDVLRIP